jgi:23S rRNA pseudouridine2605 synthase
MPRKTRDRRIHEDSKPHDGAHEESRDANSAPGANKRSAWPDVAVGPAPGSTRIAKTMARAGVCSRRDAEAWIAAGRVAVNGGTIMSPAVTVTSRDRITIDGKPLPRRERTRLFLFHKPEGLVSTNADPQGRPIVFDGLPANLPRLMSIGRLDIGTEGLLLLTNDGGLARVLELPQTAWLRCYRVRAHGHVDEADLAALRDGITIDGIQYGPIEAKLEHRQGTNAWLAFAIREGKNREVRNVLAHLGLMVNRLIRIAFGPFRLDDLAPGAIVEVASAELRKELGEQVVAQARCDFSAPIIERHVPVSREERQQGEERKLREPRDARRSGASRGGERARDRQDAPRERSSEHRGGRGKPNAGERLAKPRPRRGHAWRQDDAPLRRHYRGSRRADLQIADEETPDRHTSLLTDRKGRRIFVERFGAKSTGETEKTAKFAATPAGTRERVAPRETQAPRLPRPPRRPPRDRSSGPRPSRPKPTPRSAPRDVESRPGRPVTPRPPPSNPKQPRVLSKRRRPPRPSRER